MFATTHESTLLATSDYDTSAQRLWLELRCGAVYCYFDVPPAVHQGLIEAPSKGAYFNQNIRGSFPYQRQTDATPATRLPAATATTIP